MDGGAGGEAEKALTGQVRASRTWRIDGLDMQFVKSAKKGK